MPNVLENVPTGDLLAEVIHRAKNRAGEHRKSEPEAGRMFSLARTAAEEALFRFRTGLELAPDA